MPTQTNFQLRACGAEITDYQFLAPLKLGKATITTIPYVTFNVTAIGASGEAEVIGCSTGAMSAPWALPGVEFGAGVAFLRSLAEWIAEDARNITAAAHPLTVALAVESSMKARLPQLEERIGLPPNSGRLALRIMLAPFQWALLDAWGKAMGLPPFACFKWEHLEGAVSALENPYRDPIGVFENPPIAAVSYMHMVSAAAPLEGEGSLRAALEGMTVLPRLKIKIPPLTKDGGLQAIADRIVAVGRIFLEVAKARGERRPWVVVDINEALTPAQTREMFELVVRAEGRLGRIVKGFEQPFRRTERPDLAPLLHVGLQVWADEAIVDPEDVPFFLREGVSWVARASRGVFNSWMELQQAQVIGGKLAAPAYISDLTAIGPGAGHARLLGAMVGCPLELNGWMLVGSERDRNAQTPYIKNGYVLTD